MDLFTISVLAGNQLPQPRDFLNGFHPPSGESGRHGAAGKMTLSMDTEPRDMPRRFPYGHLTNAGPTGPPALQVHRSPGSGRVISPIDLWSSGGGLGQRESVGGEGAQEWHRRAHYQKTPLYQ